VEGHRDVAAVGDIFADGVGGEGGVGKRAGRVVAEAVVEDVDGVEVVDAEGGRGGADAVVDFIGDVFGEVV
jgi:hypothetical protein